MGSKPSRPERMCRWIDDVTLVVGALTRLGEAFAGLVREWRRGVLMAVTTVIVITHLHAFAHLVLR